jgi:hypothetical protein
MGTVLLFMFHEKLNKTATFLEDLLPYKISGTSIKWRFCFFTLEGGNLMKVGITDEI